MLHNFIRGCQTGDIDEVRRILSDSSFDPNELGECGRVDKKNQPILSSGFYEACRNGHTEIVTLLLQDSRIEVNKENNHGFTGFMYASYNGHREIVTSLLQD